MARSPWQPWRGLRRADRQEEDRAGFTDEEPETPGRRETADSQHAVEPTENSAEGKDAEHTPRKSIEPAVMGLGVVVGVVFIACCLVLLSKAVQGELVLPWETIRTLVMGLVLAICLVAIAWWLARAWRQRKNTPTETNPRAGRTEDDQNSVGAP